MVLPETHSPSELSGSSVCSPPSDDVDSTGVSAVMISEASVETNSSGVSSVDVNGSMDSVGSVGSVDSEVWFFSCVVVFVSWKERDTQNCWIQV